MMPNLERLSGTVCLVVFALVAGFFPRAAIAAESGVFGSTTRSETALIGILYDLKQDQQNKTKEADFATVLGRFLRENWDEGILNEFYRATRPLYTTQVFVPKMNADHAPRAFGVEKLVKPRRWVIHYKGQVSPPRDGTFRFVGLSDDLLAVAVDGKTVLVAEHPGSKLKDSGWRNAPRDGPMTPSGESISGDWFTVRKDQIIDLDVLIGERPGGQFGAWLMIEEQGAPADKDDKGKAVLPVFQLIEAPVPGGQVPKVRKARPEEIWKGVQ